MIEQEESQVLVTLPINFKFLMRSSSGLWGQKVACRGISKKKGVGVFVGVKKFKEV